MFIEVELNYLLAFTLLEITKKHLSSICQGPHQNLITYPLAAQHIDNRLSIFFYYNIMFNVSNNLARYELL